MKGKFVLGNGSVARRDNTGFHNERLTPINGILRAVAAKLPPNERVAHKEKRSSRPPSARFTDEQVRALRRIFARGASLEDLAILLDMHMVSVKNIVTGQNYSKVL